jgi:hypothetical protein
MGRWKKCTREETSDDQFGEIPAYSKSGHVSEHPATQPQCVSPQNFLDASME